MEKVKGATVHKAGSKTKTPSTGRGHHMHCMIVHYYVPVETGSVQ
jgi:hypothetical protein